MWLFNNSSVYEECSQLMPDGTDWTHVEDLNDLLEILVPGTNHIFLILGVDESRKYTSLTPIENLRLDLCHSFVIHGL